MAIKRTIAIVGATENTGAEMAQRFAGINYRLLLVSNDVEELKKLVKNISEEKPMTEIDSIECVKDGCWEADIIILAVPSSVEKQVQVAEMMKEVATQKMVVTISGLENSEEELKKILPYSKVIKISNPHQSKEIFISGEDEEATEEISMIFFKAGYHPTIKNDLPGYKPGNH